MSEPLVAATFCATLVDEWVRLGLTDVVVCPGSRSTPMALALAEHGDLRVHVHHDERSGSFTALGLALATGRPVAVLTTSGTAAVEVHPAVVEASYAGVPLLLLTADRPPELQRVGAPQTIDQHELFGSSARVALDPGPPDELDPTTWRALAQQAWAGAAGTLEPDLPPGPVQVNLAFREPLLGPVGPLPSPLPPPDPPVAAGPDEAWVQGLVAELDGRRVLVVAGAGIDDPSGVAALAEVAGWPMLADPLSGCRRPASTTVAHADALLRHEAFASSAEVRPEVVLRLGRPWASKVLGRWLAGLAVPQVLVEATGLPADPDRVVGQATRAEPGVVCRQVLAAGVRPAPAAWLDAWASAERRAASAVEDVLAEHVEPTEPATARSVAAALSEVGSLVVSSSMPVRDLEGFAAPRIGVRVLSNRGVNGIDGVVSTAVGVALAGAPTACLIGDVAFLHDSNGLLGAARRHLDLVVVVVDNDGGGIFSFLPPALALPEARYEQLFGTPHGVDVAALARVHGATVSEVETADAVGPAVELGLAEGGLQVLVVRTDRRGNVAVHDEIHAAVAAALVEGSSRG